MKEHPPPHTLTFFYAASFLGLCLTLLPWLSNYWAQVINTDVAYLTLSAEKMLSGMKMSEAYYDTNLPLSMIAQIPAAALTKLTGMPIYYTSSIYALSLLALSMIAVWKLLSYFEELSPEQRYTMLGIYLYINTLFPEYDFGQKDHFLGLALFPLVLTQILITRKVTIPESLKHSLLAVGSFFILIKPHFGIIPAFIFIHRAITQRRLSVVLDKDFLWLAGMTLGYIAVLFVFFNDFITVILPDILTYYASDISEQTVATGVILIIQAIVPFFAAQLFFKKAPGLISAFSLIAALGFIPFILQGKGWAYHALPADMFFYSAVILLIGFSITAGLNALRNTDEPNTFTKLVSFTVPMALVVFLILKSYAAMPDRSYVHDDYKNTAFAKRLEQCVNKYREDCNFLMLNDVINTSQELEVYTGVKHTLRFPLPWFFPVMLNAQKALDEGKPDAPMTQEDLDKAADKFMGMIAEDFEKNDPKLVFVVHVPNPANRDELFNAYDYTLEKAPDLFEPLWDRYELESSEMIDRIDYMFKKMTDEELVRYDIYKKKEK